MKSISLFSGCLGFDLGMEMAGIKTNIFVEKDKNCQKTIISNRPNAIIFDDIFSSDFLSFSKTYKPDIVFGGPPCQSFSTIGKRISLDERGICVFGFVEVIRTSLPNFFAFENVPGIMSAEKGKIVDDLLRKFKQIGYSVTYGILNSMNFGVPQIRKRFFMIGVRGKSDCHLPIGNTKVKILRESINDIEDAPGECAAFPHSIGRIMPFIPEGGCWKSLSVKDQKKIMGNATLSSGGLTAFYRRLTYDKPSPTLLTSPVQRATTLCHPRKNRPLSINEYKRIQCFPDTWNIYGSLCVKYRQLGNAVPVLLGKAIGSTIVKMAK